MTVTAGVLLLVAAWLTGVLLAAEARHRVVVGYAGEHPPRWLLLRAQLVGTALNRVVPWGGGLLSAHGRLLARRGHSAEVVGTCLGGYAAAGLLTHAALCSVAVALVAFTGVLPAGGALPRVPGPVVLLAVGAAGAIVALLLLHPAARRFLARPLLAMRAFPRTIARDPLTFLRVCALQLVAQVVVVVALLGALLATGTHVPFLALLAMALLANAVTSGIPSPAGTGPAEAALIGGLLLLGVGLGPATAGVALFRLVTHWLPVPIGAALATGELADLLRRRRARNAASAPDRPLGRARLARPTLATVD